MPTMFQTKQHSGSALLQAKMLQLCRTCHSEITTNDFIAIHDNNVKSTSVKSQLLSCIPELQQYLLKDPVLCLTCVDALSSAYSFKMQCLQTEERIRNYFLNTKLSEKSITLVELYKQVTKVSAPCNSLEQESLNIFAGNNADAEYDSKDFVIAQDLPIFKEEICDANKERTNNMGSEDVCTVSTGAPVDFETIIKIEPDLTQFKVEDNLEEDDVLGDNELEKLTLLDESLQRTQKRLKNSEECFAKFDGLQDLSQLQSANTLKSNSSCVVPTYRSERTEPESRINENLLLENSASNLVGIHTDEKPYKCGVCKYRTSLRRSLIHHMRTHSGKKLYRCNICEFNAIRKFHLEMHMSIHTGEKPFRCHVCGYRAAQRANLITHIRTHSNEKPFQCNICEYSATRKNHLKTHMLTHTKEKPFQCNICEFSTALKQSLTQHVRTHTGEKPFVCSICEYTTSRQLNLANHMKTHTGAKPFVCSVCEFSTAQHSNLARHRKIHTGEKPFVCSFCEYRTARKHCLTIHLRTHTGEKPFLCSVCEFRCAQQISLTRHMRTHTNK